MRVLRPPSLALHPSSVAPTALRWQTDACAPLATSAAAVEPVWRRLADRSAGLGLPLPRVATTSDPDLRLVVDPGGPVERSVADRHPPSLRRREQVCFVLPDRVTTVRILSRWTVPAVLTPATDDRRRLGIGVHRIILERGADRHEMAVDDPGIARRLVGRRARGNEAVALDEWQRRADAAGRNTAAGTPDRGWDVLPGRIVAEPEPARGGLTAGGQTGVPRRAASLRPPLAGRRLAIPLVESRATTAPPPRGAWPCPRARRGYG